jgi:hypothetical protein
LTGHLPEGDEDRELATTAPLAQRGEQVLGAPRLGRFNPPGADYEQGSR